MKQIKFSTADNQEPKKSGEKSAFQKARPLLFFLAGLFLFFLVVNFLFKTSGEFSFSFPGVGEIIKPKDTRVNVLLLGNAGGKHDGAYLTDTIMVASFDPKDEQTYFFSLPRDLWLDSYKLKINAIYETGQDKEDDGLKFSKKVIGDILGLEINYGIRLDFRGFTQAVDEVGGIDVNVAKTFDDYLYPITGKEEDLCGYVEQEKEFNEEEAKALNIEPGKRQILISPEGKIATDSAQEDKGFQYFTCRYEHIHFEKGLNQMDGETALKFVRSRHGTGSEGSDFARSARQQKVIEAFQSKVFSVETLLNPVKIGNLIKAFGQSFESDIPIDQMIRLYNLTKKSKATHTYVLSNIGKDALLVNPPVGTYKAWVLVPKDPSFVEIQSWVKSVLSGEAQNEASSSARPSGR
jgi:polyisoprenyl-teichoic acid--peptidoglycan teichoic acid transferase